MVQGGVDVVWIIEFHDQVAVSELACISAPMGVSVAQNRDCFSRSPAR